MTIQPNLDMAVVSVKSCDAIVNSFVPPNDMNAARTMTMMRSINNAIVLLVSFLWVVLFDVDNGNTNRIKHSRRFQLLPVLLVVNLSKLLVNESLQE
jgi:hypothetical protein